MVVRKLGRSKNVSDLKGKASNYRFSTGKTHTYQFLRDNGHKFGRTMRRVRFDIRLDFMVTMLVIDAMYND